jgi:serine protease Do
MRFQFLTFLSSLSLIVLANGVALISANASSVPPTLKQDIPTEAVSEEGTPVVVEGSLEPGDSVLSSDGSLYDEHTLDGVAGQTVTITLESPDFDTYLFLIGPDGNVVAENDDISAENLNSELTVTLEADGVYTIVANGFDAQSQGAYTLTVTKDSLPE